MPRIQPITVEQAEPKAREILEGLNQKLGRVPNIFATMAHSPAVLNFYTQASGALGAAKLPAKLREQLAVAIAGASACEYCAAAHTAIGQQLGVPAEELGRNLRGEASDAKAAAAIQFARQVVARRGWVEDADLTTVRAAGYGDREILEIVAVVALNLFTNYFNHLAGTEVDFPHVEVGAPAGV